MKKIILIGALGITLILSGCTSTNTNNKSENSKKEEKTQVQEVMITDDNFDIEKYKDDLREIMFYVTKYEYEAITDNLLDDDYLKISDERLKDYKKDYNDLSKDLKKVQAKYKNVNNKDIEGLKTWYDAYVKYFDLRVSHYLELVESKTTLDDEFYNASDEYYHFAMKLSDKLDLNKSN
jgi:hypothetical protein